MKNKICNFLTEYTKWVKWVFSGIGSGIAVLVISLTINSTCSNAEDKNHTVTNNSGIITRDISGDISGTINSGTINHGDKVSGNKVTAETIKHEEYKDNSRKIEVNHGGDYIENIEKPTIIQTPPSFREVTVASNKEGNPIGIADNPSPIQDAAQLLGKLMRGEEVKIEQASPSKFLINSGTEISVLKSDASSEQPPTGFIDPIGFTKFEEIKILEGPHKGKTGWIHASMISHEQRKK